MKVRAGTTSQEAAGHRGEPRRIEQTHRKFVIGCYEPRSQAQFAIQLKEEERVRKEKNSLGIQPVVQETMPL